jgi:predicted phosphodiesterase
MRYAILADIHANLKAFMAVLKDIEHHGEANEIWCLGDIVGYGPQPHQCIELLRQTNHICVAGNHDLAAAGQIDTYNFNPDAAAAIIWTARQVTSADTAYIRNLPLTLVKTDFTLAHGSPRQPVWEYILSTSIAKENFEHFNSKYCLVCHTHMPVAFRLDKKGVCHYQPLEERAELELGEERLIINPGAVGQPRDGDPRASYAIYDSDTSKLSLYRVPYDITATQNLMIEQGLPIRLVARLSHGQ